MTDSADKPAAPGLDALGEMAFANPLAAAADPLAAYRHSLDGWGKLLAPLAAAGRSKLNPRDRRFAGSEWEHPVFDLMRQGYQVMSDYMLGAAEAIEGIDPAQKARMAFAIRTLVEAMSPANSPLTNPVALEKAIETKGQSLMAGMQHMMADIQRGQLTHTDPQAFRLGENIAATPGKVVYQTALFQLVQYAPSTETVLKTPLVIFPPWINRFYILDLTAEKSFIKWCADQGITVFTVSWKSADASMKDVVWDDYIAAQIEAVDTVRGLLEVKNVHAIGYCVAGTTLAATLSVLAAQGRADIVESATFFTAQVDFARAGELLNFIDDDQIKMIGAMAKDGYVDGRVLALTFNLLRGKDLIWSTVVSNWLLGEDYPAFDLLHWNGDVTNLPARWHQEYLCDLYRDNRLVQPGAMSALGVPIDLTRVETPSYIQAGREDHIAPLESVWKITEHFKGPLKFLLAGSGHIAGVVNPPSMQKYQYWTNDTGAKTLDAFIAGATETKGSWWPHWAEWLKGHGGKTVAADGARQPGGGALQAIEDAPGRYVKTR
jgi:polyhydroxyalkanoate synthase